ncbi:MULTISPECIES: hypothetical protein [Bacillaceae]|nr:MULTISPECIES: hypothetical protein [Bacillaceae]
MTHIDHMVKTAGQLTVTRLKSASAAIKDGTKSPFSAAGSSFSLG